MSMKNSRYLSWRIRFFAALMLASYLVFVLLAVMVEKDDTARLFLCAAAGILLAAALLVFHYWIRNPWRQIQRLLTRIGEGYFPEEKPNPQGEVMLSPAFGKVIEKTYDLRHSQQYHMMNKRQIQYLALQNQINPHFLYNTLDGIRSEALLEGNATVAEMSEALATFFRYTISKVENLVTIEEELENCETYFRIQQFRFGDRLKLEIVKDEEWDKLSGCLIPKLTLQPILENSIIHGTELKLGEGISRIIIRRSGRLLLIRVSDNGVGMNEETLQKLNSRMNTDPDIGRGEGSGSIALANVSNRIHLIFGEDYHIHVYSIENHGTDVDITLPCVYSEKEIEKVKGLS